MSKQMCVMCGLLVEPSLHAGCAPTPEELIASVVAVATAEAFTLSRLSFGLGKVSDALGRGEYEGAHAALEYLAPLMKSSVMGWHKLMAMVAARAPQDETPLILGADGEQAN